MIRYLKFITLVLTAIPLLFSCTEKKKDTVTSGDTLRLITYNVWYGFTRLPERKTEWLEWMKQQQPDIVALQELNEYTPEQLEEDALTWGHSHTALLKTEGFPTGVTSRFPIEDVQRTQEGFHHGLMRVKIKGIYFYIIHLHPSNWEVRIKEVNQILKDIGQLPSDVPVVLAGDFNTFSRHDSVFYSHGRLIPFFQQRDVQYNEQNLNEGRLDYTAIDELLKQGFEDTEVMFRGSEYEFTGSFPTLIEKEGEHGDLRRLDYVFVNDKLSGKILEAEIVANQTTRFLSDHLPMIVDFRHP